MTLVGLIRSGLLKRFESSAHAFALTTERMADSHDAFLKALDAGYILSPKALEEWTSIDSDEEWERLLEETGAEWTRSKGGRVRSLSSNPSPLAPGYSSTSGTSAPPREFCPRTPRPSDGS